LDFPERASGTGDLVSELYPFHRVDAHAGELRDKKRTSGGLPPSPLHPLGGNAEVCTSREIVADHVECFACVIDWRDGAAQT